MIHKLFNIKYPIIQGAMANIATAKFAATVSNSGGLGIIATGAMNPEQVREAIRDCKTMTENPFGVNVMLMNPHSPEIIKVICEEHVDVVTTGAGNPGPYIAELKAAGCKVVPVVPSVALAVRMTRHPIDALIVEGTEAGGHVGELTTMALVPQVVQAVNVPVIAAGGIGDGHGFNAAIALGAQGVQIGTCLLVADECEIHENYKQAVIHAKDTDTVVTGRSAGVPVRILKNQMSREYLKLEASHSDREALERLTLGALRRAVFDGDVDYGSVMIGQIAGLCKATKPLKTILDEMMTEAIAQQKQLSSVYQELEAYAQPVVQ